MSDLYFEGHVLVDEAAGGMMQSAEPVKIADGLDREAFSIRLSSVSRTNFHPIMDQLRGRKVRITFRVLP